jgi:aryl-alcohol dehydrogenase-like predicted oxidoreductase
VLDGTLPGVALGTTGLCVSVIGLGCSRLGSVLANCSGDVAIRLVHHAVARGIVLFDTADIYGQGESERLLGHAVRANRNKLVLVTKAGQRFTTTQRLASLAKRPIRHLSHRFPAFGGVIAKQRAQPLRRDFTPAHLRRALERSLRRLNTDWIDLFLLHSPDAAVAREGEVFEVLKRAQEQGLISHWGVSCDDLPTVRAVLRVPGLAALQLPLAVAQATDETGTPLAATIAARQVGLLVREVLATPSRQPATVEWRSRRMASALELPNAAVLVGTTSQDHLDEALAGLSDQSRSSGAATRAP